MQPLDEEGDDEPSSGFVPARTARGDGAGVLIHPDGTPLTDEEIAEQEAAEARGEFDDDEWDDDEEDAKASRAMMTMVMPSASSSATIGPVRSSSSRSRVPGNKVTCRARRGPVPVSRQWPRSRWSSNTGASSWPLACFHSTA